MDKIAVVILNWNGKQFLEIFLKIIIDRSPEAEIWIADNSSTDDSVTFLKKKFSGVHILEFDSNYGYTGGYNKALNLIDADFYILLNSDIEVSDGWLGPLITMMKKDSSVAAIQPKILSFAEKDKFEYAGASGGFIDILGYPFCRGRFIGQKTEFDNGQYNDSREIFWATGAALMVRGELFKKIGGLDNNFFAHMEEIDLCWRLKRAGYKIMVEPKSVVYHVGGGTLPVWSPRKTYLNFRNNISMLYKNLSIKQFIITYIIRILTDSLRALSYLIQCKWKFFMAVINGHIDFWKVRKCLNRQNEIGHKKVNNIYKGSIVMKQFLGKNTFGHMMTILAIIVLLSCKVSCKETTNVNLFNITQPSSSEIKKIGDLIEFKIAQISELDSLNIFVDGKKISGETYRITRVGTIGYSITGYKNGKKDYKKGSINVVTDKVPSIKKISIVKTFPHNTDAYTQGLLYNDKLLYESVGEYEHSSVRIVEPSTGKVIKEKKLAKKYFGEGLELVNGKLFQLTWREKTCFCYDATTLKEIAQYKYKGEGWGLTTNGKVLYMSDGSSSIKIINPETFKQINRIDVADQRGGVKFLNELEWINGKIWANIYLSNWIAIINPETGEVETYVDCSPLNEIITHNTDTDVLNGIAYDKENNEVYLTGKKWDKMFLIKNVF